MNIQDLKDLLEKSNDKVSILADLDALDKYTINVTGFVNLVNEFLSDEEKVDLFSNPKFKQIKVYIKSLIIQTFSDEQLILQIMNNDNIMNGIKENDIVEILKKTNDSVKYKLLKNQDFMKKYQFSKNDMKNVISSFGNEAKVMMDKDLIINKLQLDEFQIAELIKELPNQEDKSKMLEVYEVFDYQKIDIIKTFSYEGKINALLNENDCDKSYKIELIKSLDVEDLCKFFKEHKDFYYDNNIIPYEISMKLSEEKQKEFIANLENINLTLDEKREVLVTLKSEVKKNIDTTNFPKEYISVLDMQTIEFNGKIIWDMDRNQEDYKGLDNLMKIDPEYFTEEQKEKFMEICDICPNLQVINKIGSIENVSTVSEYKEAEKWIESIIASLKPEYSNIQKIAVIDNAIGKKISYSPDFDTEIFDNKACRAMWKVISSGYGVCSGIASVEKYIFDRVGIENEIVSSGIHSFLKVKDLEISLENGEIIRGDTIVDPTWNLASHRFGAIPDNFCIDYEQARRNDIDIEGIDHNCHKNDEKLSGVTLKLDENDLRDVFKSVGLADKEGQFPIREFSEKSKKLNEMFINQPDQNIMNQFLLLKQYCPEFIKCQNSSRSILNDIILNNKSLRLNECVIDRAYTKTDDKKEPIIFVYVSSNELGKKFYVANKEEGEFLELTQEKFAQQFECYESDKDRLSELNLWEVKEQNKDDRGL